MCPSIHDRLLGITPAYLNNIYHYATLHTSTITSLVLLVSSKFM